MKIFKKTMLLLLCLMSVFTLASCDSVKGNAAHVVCLSHLKGHFDSSDVEIVRCQVYGYETGDIYMRCYLRIDGYSSNSIYEAFIDETLYVGCSICDPAETEYKRDIMYDPRGDLLYEIYE